MLAYGRTWVKNWVGIVIFHGYVSHNQMISIELSIDRGITIFNMLKIYFPWLSIFHGYKNIENYHSHPQGLDLMCSQSDLSLELQNKLRQAPIDDLFNGDQWDPTGLPSKTYAVWGPSGWCERWLRKPPGTIIVRYLCSINHSRNQFVKLEFFYLHQLNAIERPGASRLVMVFIPVWGIFQPIDAYRFDVFPVSG